MFMRDCYSSRADYQSLLKGSNFQDLYEKAPIKFLIVYVIGNFGF